MNIVAFQCGCGQKIEAPATMSGQECACPTCNTTIKIPRDWSSWRWVVPLIALIIPLWWDYDWWKSDHSAFPDVQNSVLVGPSFLWAAIALGCIAKAHRDRAVAVLGCGIMAFGWWGLRSIPCVIVGGVLLLFGLANMVIFSLKKHED
jgi:hypothetical protein